VRVTGVTRGTGFGTSINEAKVYGPASGGGGGGNVPPVAVAAATATAPAALPTTTTVEVADDDARGQNEETGGEIEEEGGEDEEGDIELTRGSDGSPDQPDARIDARAQRTPPAAVAAAAGSGAGGGSDSGGGFGATPLTGSSSGRTGDTSDLLLGLRDDDSLYFTSD
jgi:hypothetical protein